MQRMICVLAAMVAVLAGASSAEAQRYRGERAGMDWETMHFGSETYPQALSSRAIRADRASSNRANRSRELASLSYTGGVGPRPRKWCGWWMRTQLGGGPAFNLAWNWRNYGSPTVAQVGAVVVWRGHVGIITGQASNGQWIVKSGNDGGRVRERARSVAGAIFRI
jgi:hypothetical protein